MTAWCTLDKSSPVLFINRLLNWATFTISIFHQFHILLITTQFNPFFKASRLFCVKVVLSLSVIPWEENHSAKTSRIILLTEIEIEISIGAVGALSWSLVVFSDLCCGLDVALVCTSNIYLHSWWVSVVRKSSLYFLHPVSSSRSLMPQILVSQSEEIILAKVDKFP